MDTRILKNKIKIYNPATGNIWTPTIDNYLNRMDKDPATRYTRGSENRTRESVSSRLDNYNIIVCESLDRKIKYKCLICSRDKYTSAGLCGGIFSIDKQALLKGALSCRCSNYLGWTKEQREFQILEFCNSTGYKFKGWVAKYTNITSRIFLQCQNGHTREYGLGSAVYKTASCKTCKGTMFNGFCEKRKEEDGDTLYHVRFGEEYDKVGRSFDLNDRIHQSGGLSKASGYDASQIKILNTYQGTHEEVFNTEQYIHGILRSRGYSYTKETWSTELFKIESEELVTELLENSKLEKY